MDTAVLISVTHTVHCFPSGVAFSFIVNEWYPPSPLYQPGMSLMFPGSQSPYQKSVCCLGSGCCKSQRNPTYPQQLRYHVSGYYLELSRTNSSRLPSTPPDSDTNPRRTNLMRLYTTKFRSTSMLHFIRSYLTWHKLYSEKRKAPPTYYMARNRTYGIHPHREMTCRNPQGRDPLGLKGSTCCPQLCRHHRR
jgi:hypothetical protein